MCVEEECPSPRYTHGTVVVFYKQWTWQCGWSKGGEYVAEEVWKVIESRQVGSWRPCKDWILIRVVGGLWEHEWHNVNYMLADHNNFENTL